MAITELQLRNFLAANDIHVEGYEDGWEISFYSPAGEDFVMYLAGQNIEELLKSLQEYQFDAEEHAYTWYGANRGEPSSLKELLEDAEAIAQEIKELKRKVNNFIEPNTAPVSNRACECPFCGSPMLDYGDLETANHDIYYPWTCLHCGASGREIYELSFVGHYQCVSPNGECFEKIDNN